MKGLLIKMLLFSFPIIFLLGVAEHVLRNEPNVYATKFKMYISSLDSIETFVLGGSNAFYGINPNFIESKTFNMAMISQTMIYNNYMLKSYQNRMINLKNIIVPITYYSTYNVDGSGEDKWRKYYYYHFYDHCQLLLPKLSIEKYSVLKTLTVKSGMNTFLDIVLHRRKKEICDTKGWFGGYQAQVQNIASFGPITAKRHENNLCDPTNTIRLLKEMIEICNKKGVNVILLFTPNLHYYTDCLKKNKLDIMFTSVSNIAEEYKNVYVLDFYFGKKFEKEDFFDCDHLNSNGAEKFSKILNDTLISLKLIRHNKL